RGLTDDDIKARLSRWTRRELDRVLTRVGSGGEEVRPIAVTQKLVGNIQQAAMSECCVPSTTEMPIWIDCAGPCPRNVVPVQNGLLDVVSGELHPHTPAFFSPTVVPYAYDPSAPEPREWLRFLDSVFHDDRESIITLQEWFGYLLTADTSQQKILLMIGPKRSGKGTILRVLTAMVGKGNVVSPSFGSLAWVHGLQEFPGKTIATISDARLDSRKDGSTAVERLLSISGEDTVTVNPKNRALFSARLLTRFVIATNELPRFGDASGALPGRFIILRFLYSYYGREDHGLENRLIAELPGILNWSIAGLQRLRERGRFRQPASSQELMQTLEELASPVSTFIADRGFVHRAATVPINDLYQAYRLWCEDNGHMPGSKQVFGRNLQAVLPQVQIRRIGKASDRHRVYQGIRLRRYDDPETPETDDPGGKPGVFPPDVRDDVRDQKPIADMRNQQTSAGISKDRKMSAMSAMSAMKPENSFMGKEKTQEPPGDLRQTTLPGCVDLDSIRNLMH
ncbi:MAG: phage/plasmid primase, P4 family, partial [Bacteroidales bacterium]|nr:phage/plasmid primase, P4 family [Bacteroidales bacterium]